MYQHGRILYVSALNIGDGRLKERLTPAKEISVGFIIARDN